MAFIDYIIEELEDARDWFYDAYLEVRDWISPFNLLQYPLYGLYGVFMWLVQDFEDFKDWLEWARDEIYSILSWANIRSLIRSWLDGIEDALDWFSAWAYWVGDYIADWWAGILPYVLTYVDDAVEGLSALVAAWDNFWTVTWPQWISIVEEIRGAWDNFWYNILPELVSFTWLTSWWHGRLLDIEDLINSWFIAFAPYWEGWQEIRDQVIDFFNDPLEWLLERFTDWFLGPE